MISLLALVVRLFILAVFTFGFVVLYEHGSANYLENAQADGQQFLKFVQERTGATAPAAAPAPAAPTAPLETPTPASL